MLSIKHARVSPTRSGSGKSGGVELILEGAIFYMRDDAQIIGNLFGNDNASHGSTRSLNIRRSLLTLRGFAETELPKPAAGQKTSGNSLPTQDPASRKRTCVWLPLERFLAADPSRVPVMSMTIGTGLWRDAGSDWHPWVKTGQTAEAQRNPESSSM